MVRNLFKTNYWRGFVSAAETYSKLISGRGLLGQVETSKQKENMRSKKK